MQRKVLLWPVVLLLFCLSGVLLASGQNTTSENKRKRPVAAKKSEAPKKGVATDSRPASTTAIDSDLLKAAPLQGRSLQPLLNILPGVVRTFDPYDKAGQFSVNGLRTDANYWTVDGVSANVGISLIRNPSTDQTLTGAVPAFNAWGGTNSMIATEAVAEFMVGTSNYRAEFGRLPSAQVQLTSRSGTNALHGSAYEYFGNGALNANDWFSKSYGLPKPGTRQNDFGFTLGGPVRKDRTFFFASYEGLRAMAAQGTTTMYVPALSMRNNPNLSANIRALLNAYPAPTGPEVLSTEYVISPFGPATLLKYLSGYAPAASSASAPLYMDAYSLRLDHKIGSRWNTFIRYNVSPSSTSSVLAPTRSSYQTRLTTVTAGATAAITPHLTNDFRANYSKNGGETGYSYYAGAGAVVPDASVLYSGVPAGAKRPGVAHQFFNGLQPLVVGTGAANLARQWNLVDTVTWVHGAHALKFGTDFRYVFPRYAGTDYGLTNNYFSSWRSGSFLPALGALIPAPYTTYAITHQTSLTTTDPVTVVSRNLSLYAQDTWKVSPRLTLDYGIRWEYNPAPEGRHAGDLMYVTGPPVNSSPPPILVPFAPTLDFLTLVPRINGLSGWLIGSIEPNAPTSTLAFAPPGTTAYSVGAGAIAPRFGFGYQLHGRSGWETLLRGGWGLFYDTGSSQAAASAGYYPHNRNTVLFSQNSFLPSLDPSSGEEANLNAVFPNYSTPRVHKYSLRLEQRLGTGQFLRITWVANAGRRLMRQYTFEEFTTGLTGTSASYKQVYVNRNDGLYGDTSDYNALQTQYKRRLSSGFYLAANYTWAHAIDTASDDVSGSSPYSEYPAEKTRGNSSFYRRHSLSLALTYQLPQFGATENKWFNTINTILLKNWTAGSFFEAQSGMPGSVTYLGTAAGILNRNSSDLTSGYLMMDTFRANRVSGKPLYVADSTAPGGKKLNREAFDYPGCASQVPACNGNLQRNGVPGLGFWQADFALSRNFKLRESWNLQFRTEMYNVFNHPNFAYSDANLGVKPTTGSTGFSGNTGFDASYAFANVLLGTYNTVTYKSISVTPSGISSNTVFVPGGSSVFAGVPNQTAARAYGTGVPGTGLDSMYQSGGPRIIQFALKLQF